MNEIEENKTIRLLNKEMKLNISYITKSDLKLAELSTRSKVKVSVPLRANTVLDDKQGEATEESCGAPAYYYRHILNWNGKDILDWATATCNQHQLTIDQEARAQLVTMRGAHISNYQYDDFVRLLGPERANHLYDDIQRQQSDWMVTLNISIDGQDQDLPTYSTPNQEEEHNFTGMADGELMEVLNYDLITYQSDLDYLNQESNEHLQLENSIEGVSNEYLQNPPDYQHSSGYEASDRPTQDDLTSAIDDTVTNIKYDNSTMNNTLIDIINNFSTTKIDDLLNTTLDDTAITQDCASLGVDDATSCVHDDVKADSVSSQNKQRRTRRQKKKSNSCSSQKNMSSQNFLDFPENNPYGMITSGTGRIRDRNPRSWEFLARLIVSRATNPSVVRWEEKETGTFRLVDKEEVANLWAQRSGRKGKSIAYDSFARILRYHYNNKTKAVSSVSTKHLVYKFSDFVMQEIKKYELQNDGLEAPEDACFNQDKFA